MDFADLIRTILVRRQHVPAAESLLVAISGIDGSGKGYVTERLVERLRGEELNAVHLNVDGWLNLPGKRFNPENPAEQFYLHAIRFEDMFEQLVLPLKRNRSVRQVADFTEETAQEYRRHVYDYREVDVVVLEGIYLFKRELRDRYDWKVWVDCTFETALERALHRAQEGLPPDQTIRAYQIIYFPAQEIHFARDDPRASADSIVVNDPRLEQTPDSLTAIGAG